MITIPTRTHGIIDYVAGAAMLAAPLLIKNGHAEQEYDIENWEPESLNGSAETKVLAAMGAAVLTQSLMTDYELGAVKLINMRSHLLADVAGGLLLAASPWLFNMDSRLRIPIAALGLSITALGLLTNTRPEGTDEEE